MTSSAEPARRRPAAPASASARAMTMRCRWPPRTGADSGRMFRPQPDLGPAAQRPAPQRRPRANPRTSSGSPTAAPTVIRGLSEVAGSWNTICTRARIRAVGARSAPPTRCRHPTCHASAPQADQLIRRPWTCRNRTCPPARRFAWPQRERDAVDGAHRGPCRAGKCTARSSTAATASPHRSACQHAESWPSSTARKAAAAPPQRCIGQRAAAGEAAAGNDRPAARHPPSITASPISARRSAAASRPAAAGVGMARRREHRLRRPVSAIRPAYITATRSAISATTPSRG